VARRVHEADRPLKFGVCSAAGAGRRHAKALRLIAVRALVDGRIGVSQFDCDASLKLLTVAGGPDAREGLDQRGLAVVDVTDGADVDLRLLR